MKKIISKSLCWVLVCAMVLAQFLIPMPTQAASAVRQADTNIQNGTTLHCWNWSYANILENLPTIAAQGFTAIQVSPIQKAKQPTMGSPVNDWWTFYQPAEFAIDNTGVNAMGTKAEFMNLCETAHEYGIYVIVDVVANHMAADYNYSRSPAIIDDIRNDNSCWHNRNSNINNYSSRENITQYDLDTVLDLNTGSKKVQNYVLNYLKELIDAGADGFRFDAVKHIETPDDNASFASDFWPTVVYGAETYAESKGLDLYCYGELLDHPDDVNGLPDSAYAKYYSITDNVWGNNVRDAVVAGGNAGSFSGTYHKNVSADQLVLWAESHDTYANRSSLGVSEANINKTWALVAARADAMGLYLTRTEGFTPPNALGTAYLSGWNASEVAAVNKFHKAFVGQSEYVANSGSIAYVERGTSGAVLVNVGGNGTSVNVKANRLASGTYKDQISGNTFTVSGGKITGSIGSSGIAVIYNVSACSHANHYIAGLCTVCGASVSHSYSGGVCKCGKTKPVTGSCTHSAHRYNGVCRDCGASVGHSYTNNICTVCGVQKPVDTFDYYLVGFINNSNINDIKEEYRFKDGKLTLTSSTDAWVSVRTYNGIFYQTSPDQQYNDTVTLRNASMSGGSNAQMRVPGGKTVTLQLQSNYNGTYTLSYAEGGIVTPSGNANDYYLVGWINGADYGCESDYANLGRYKFENGKLTAKFEQDSYVFVKTGDNSKWLLADSYCTDTTCTFSEGKSEKMCVPGGVELTFTLTRNSNGSVTVSYTTADGGSTDPVDPTGKTVYVDITGFDWSNVNVYTWDANGTATTGAWPGSAMTKVEGNVYSYAIPANAVNIIFNDGSNQTNDLVIPTDGKNLYNYKQNSWSNYATECKHNYTSEIVLEASCTQNGLRRYTCTLCNLSYPESIPATGHSWSMGRCTACSTVCDHNWIDGNCKTCGSACGHKWSNGKCLVCSMICGHRNWVDGACIDCGLTCSHNYANGFCTICGLSDPNNQTPNTYYLVGYINGANYGCEEDYQNMGQYKFVDGKLTASFDRDSYVFLKSEGNSGWYLTESYCTDTTATFAIGGTEKMLVPGGVEVIFTLTENVDGSLTLSYAKASHSHNYEQIIDAATCEKAGVKTFLCAQCGHSYTEEIPALGHQYSWRVAASATCIDDGLKCYTCDRCAHSYTEVIPATGHNMVDGRCVDCGTGTCAHSYTTEQLKAPTCTEGSVTRYTCTLCGYTYDEEGNPWSHNYVNGTCTMCGQADPNYVIPSGTFYLVGYINGANYGCEEDYQNMGQYKFVDGKLVAKFETDSYVFLKTENNEAWYLSMIYSPGPRCSFYNAADHSVSEKMLVPGGVEVTFYLSEGDNGTLDLSYTTPSMVCPHKTHNIDGICDSCGYQLTHHYVDGVCACGAVEPVTKPVEYFLFGYINGANYGCEEDSENMGEYKFVDGKLTATFTQDSYVGIKTTDNADWYMTNGYAGEYGVARLYNTKTLGNPDKLYVPGGVSVTFTLEVHWDKTLSLSYTTASASVVPTLTLKSPTLEFKDMITVNAMFTAENIEDVVEMGMITYSSKVDAWNVETAEHVIPGTTYDVNTGRYIAHSQGIHAKYLGDTVYMAVYAKLTDGSYAYSSKLAPYSPVQYATSQLKNSSDVKLKQLVAAMLNYGAEAQKFFGHNTENLANASLTADQKALPESYRADMVNAVPNASAEKQGAFANNKGFSKRYPAISFEGAFCINYFFKPNYTPVGDITLYYWKEADFAAADVLTTENASGSMVLALEDSGEYRGDIVGISAKNLSEAVYVAAVYSDGTTTWTSGVLGYSIGAYCSGQSSKGAAVAALAEATAVYGYHAKAYFG